MVLQKWMMGSKVFQNITKMAYGISKFVSYSQL